MIKWIILENVAVTLENFGRNISSDVHYHHLLSFSFTNLK